ncbi:hypothetical protein JS82_05630 [Methanomassiliicoccaceae archaeon DOK]|nr:hypothetical protein JS82_05630 [Methanomassiliicoccaceae archaeon DOK]
MSCSNILLDSRLKIYCFEQQLGNRFVRKTLNDVINLYNGKGCMNEDYSKLISEALRKDLRKDPFIEGLMRFDAENGKRMIESLERSISVMETILKGLESDEDGYLGFVLFMSRNRSRPFDLDFEKIDRNSKRVLRQASSDDPLDSFPPLRDQYRQGFEQLYLQIAKESMDIISRYPGCDREMAYRAFEELTSLKQPIVDDEGGLKSDYRAIRNCISHENYRENGDSMVMCLDDGRELTIGIKDMSFLNTSMLHKCIYSMQLVSLMNVEIIRRARSYI